MKISGIILVFVAAFLIYKIQTDQTDQTGGTLTQITIDNRYQDPYYGRQYRELDDVDNVLNRPQEPGKEGIQSLAPINAGPEVDGPISQLRLLPPVERYLNFNDIQKTDTTEQTKVLIEGQQPYFLDEALIIDHYGEKYYWDWRYPKQPIAIQFIQDPEGYIRDHPNEYPSYVIKSRDYTNLGPS
jgi:hypothetical protein